MKIFSSLHVKLLSGFIIALAPLVYLLYINNTHAIETIRDKVARTSYAALFQYTKQTDKALKETFTYLAQLGNSQEFSLYLSSQQGSSDNSLAKFSIFNKLNNDIALYPFLDSLFLYIPGQNELLLGANHDFYKYEISIKQHLPQMLQESDNTPIWNVIKTDHGYALYKIHHITDYAVSGAWIDLNQLLTKVGFQNEYTFSQAVIVSPEGEALTKTDVNQETFEHAINIPQNEGYYVMMKESASDNKYILLRSHSEIALLNYYILIPDAEMLLHIKYFDEIGRLLPLVAGILSIWYSFIYYKVIYIPIKQMVTAMRKLGRGILETRIVESNTHEFKILIDSFNVMASKIENLKIEVYEEQLRVKQTEFKHLQSQINPHFYLNTLNIIYSLAELREFKLIQKTVRHLVQYFRYITQTGRSQIPLAEELVQVTNYLELQAMRLPDLFEYEITIPPELEQVQVPPLLVQTFVENCIKHGFVIGSSRFTIRIEGSIRYEKEMQVRQIWISDTGAGFSADKLEEMSKEDYWLRTDDQHLGLRNCYHRLRMMYGEKVNLFFFNDRGGATVLVEISGKGCQEDGHKSA